MGRASIQAGKAVIVIEAHDMVARTLGKIRTNLHRFANGVSNIGSSLGQGGIIGGIASGLIFRQFAKFDDLMLELQVKLGFLDKMTAQQEVTMKRLEHRIRSLGKTTSYTSQEIAQASVSLAQGGLSPTEIENSLGAILALARGTRAPLEDAARMFVRTMRTFNLESTKANEIVSQFVRTTRFGTLNIEDLELALRYASGTAATLEQNLSPILAIFAELSNKGLAGSIGGTSLNTAMANLVKKMGDIEQAYPGFKAVFNEQGLDLLGTFRELFKITSQLPATEQVQVFQRMFNLRGARAVAGIRDIQNVLKMAEAISMAGNEADKASKIMDSGLGGRARIALSSIQDLVLEIGKASQQYLIPFLNIVKNLVNEFNLLIQQNPQMTALVALSPVGLLAGAAGFLALGKAARILASSLTVLLTVGKPVTNLFARGVAGQIATASAIGSAGKRALIGQVVKGKGRAPAIRQGGLINARYQSIGVRKSGMLAISMQKDRIGLQRKASALQKSGAAYTARGLKLEAAANAMRVKGVHYYGLMNKAVYLQNKGLRRTRAAGQATQLAGTAGNFSKLAGLKTVGLLGKSGGGALLKFATGLLRTIGVVRRFVFSFTGLFTVIELLVTFTSLGDKLGTGFMNAFRAIGQGLKMLMAPWKLFTTSLQAIAAGHTQEGLQGLKEAFAVTASIIGNQLVAAWNRFKEALGPVYDTIRAILVTIMSTIDTLFIALKEGLGATFKTIGSGMQLLGGNFFGSDGSAVETARSVAESVAKFIPAMITWLSKLWITLNEFQQKFMAGLEYQLTKLALNLQPGSSFMGKDVFKAAEDVFNKDSNTATNNANNSRRRLDENLARQQAAIAKAFQGGAGSQGAAGASAARNRSLAAAQFATNRSNELLDIIRRGTAEAIQITSKSPGLTPSGGGFDPSNPGQVKSLLAASALVGSIQATRGNVLKFNNPIDKQQLDVLREIRDDQRKQQLDQGVRLK